MDKQIADQIITKYIQKIYGFAMKKAFSYDEAEDLCADIIQEVYSSLIKSENILNLDGYIWRISEHTYAKYVASKKKLKYVSIHEMDIPYKETFAFDNCEDDIYRLRREIAYLTEKRREIVYLFYYNNCSVSYISKKLELPEGTVKWHLNKARNKLKEKFFMERKIGKLGIAPITAVNFGHHGNPGTNEGPEFYLSNKLNLNITYSVYDTPKTRDEIADELGISPVYIEDNIHFLEENGFLVKTTGNRYTTYVCFEPETYSLELAETLLQKQQLVAKTLITSYVPSVRTAISAFIKDTYIPGGNKELLEAAAIFYGIIEKCSLSIHKDMSKYDIHTTAGGSFVATVDIPCCPSDPDYTTTMDASGYWACGSMTRQSEKYSSVSSWSVDSRYSSRKGAWKNNHTCDYEYLYEFLCGILPENAANSEKYMRLKERGFLNENNRINIMIMKKTLSEFHDRIPSLDEQLKYKFADTALEFSMIKAKNYPPQIQDLIISRGVSNFIGREVALMVMDTLYQDGTFQSLTEKEMITSNLIMFSDILPEI